MGTRIESPFDLLAFWFDGDVEDAIAMRARMAVLFKVDHGFDAKMRARFAETVEAALSGALDDWAVESRGALALVITLDQMPRNIYRGTARAFAGDARARALALAMFARGWDRELAIIERLFLYMPLEHAEDIALQHRCVAGYEALHADAPREFHPITSAAMQAGREHRAVIEQFGRFPHRNAALGRMSTAAELNWLASNRSGWGQSSNDTEGTSFAGPLNSSQ
jgi:uncharacterized protein (DUF924 family)